MRGFLFQILAGLTGVLLSAKIIPGVSFSGPTKIFILLGLSFGIINYFLKPIVSFLLSPLKLLTFGLIGLVIDIAIVWVLSSLLFPSYFQISNTPSLLLATLVIWSNSFLFSLLSKPFSQKKYYYE